MTKLNSLSSKFVIRIRLEPAKLKYSKDGASFREFLSLYTQFIILYYYFNYERQLIKDCVKYVKENY